MQIGIRNPVLSYPNRSSNAAAGLHLKNLAPDVFLRQSPKEIRAESLNELTEKFAEKRLLLLRKKQI
jgi:hypothetical protein